MNDRIRSTCALAELQRDLFFSMRKGDAFYPMTAVHVAVHVLRVVGMLCEPSSLLVTRLDICDKAEGLSSTVRVVRHFILSCEMRKEGS